MEPDGTRDDTRNSDGYFKVMRDYILDGKLYVKYGDAIVYRVSSAHQ